MTGHHYSRWRGSWHSPLQPSTYADEMYQNLFPVQIENALSAQESIQEAAVVSVPDPKFGEVVGAWIVRRPGTSVSRVSIRSQVAEAMNPQVGQI